jgi:hypothetical protein
MAIALLCCLGGLESANGAMLQTYRIGIDVGNDPGTGCNFSIGGLGAPIPGFELQVTVVVDSQQVPPQVASAKVETCNAGTFGSPQTLSGFTVALDNGLLGSDSVIGGIPL